MNDRPISFTGFWPYYLMAHRDAGCRRLHFIGTSGALVGICVAVLRLDFLWAAAGLIFAYAMAWTGHFIVERNRPATFGNPLWSLICDVRMYVLWISGGLGRALETAERQFDPPGDPRKISGESQQHVAPLGEGIFHGTAK